EKLSKIGSGSINRQKVNEKSTQDYKTCSPLRVAQATPARSAATKGNRKNIARGAAQAACGA
ncbi:hypothetical protein A2U01_0064052, partial [Trifolium medium]|nr:hypothetical protein [Trifolium medium]